MDSDNILSDWIRTSIMVIILFAVVVAVWIGLTNNIHLTGNLANDGLIIVIPTAFAVAVIGIAYVKYVRDA